MSKKALVRFNPKTRKSSRDFLAPLRDANNNVLLASLKTAKPAQFGYMVYTGIHVGANEVHRNAMASGVISGNPSEAMLDFIAYVDLLAPFRIGDVLELCPDAAASRGFTLRKAEYRLNMGKPIHLPGT